MRARSLLDDLRLVLLPMALLGLPGLASAAEAEPEFSTRETRAMMHDYAECVVEKQRAKASEAIVANVDNAALMRRYPMLISPTCLSDTAKSSVQMRFTGDLYRYALADALVNRELAGWTAGDLAAVPRLAHGEPGEPPAKTTPSGKPVGKRKYEAALEAYSTRSGFAYLSRFGECVVRSDAQNSKGLVLTRPDTPQEAAAFAALRPALQTCLPEGETLRFGKVALRGTIAINLYRLAHSARSGAAVSAASAETK